jgi:hypothetical protein
MGGTPLSFYFLLVIFSFCGNCAFFVFFRTSVITSKFGGRTPLDSLRFSSPLGIVSLPTLRTLCDLSLGVWKTVVHFLV